MKELLKSLVNGRMYLLRSGCLNIQCRCIIDGDEIEFYAGTQKVDLPSEYEIESVSSMRTVYYVDYKDGTSLLIV